MSETPPATDAALPLSGRVVLHPVAAAIYPVLALWAANVVEVRPAEVVAPLWWGLVVTAVVWLLLWWPAGGLRAAAIPASLTALGFLMYDQVFPENDHWWALAAAVGIGVLVVVFRRLRPLTVARWTAVANVAALVFVAFPVSAVVPRVVGPQPTVTGLQPPPVATTPGRDIVYIVPDRYGRADILERVYGFDNSAFVDYLEDQGFQLPPKATTNYPKTALALPASWNLNYLDELLPLEELTPDEWDPAYQLTEDHVLGRFMNAAGYHYIHLGSWFNATSKSLSADEVLRYDGLSEFQSVFRGETAFDDYRLLERIGPGRTREVEPPRNHPDEPPLYTRGLELHQYNHSTFQLDQLDRLAAESSRRPRFILAHLTQPHGPFIFDEDGTLVPRELAKQRGEYESFNRQLTYLNTRLTHVIDTLLSGPEDEHPIIVIQADEGPDPLTRIRAGNTFQWLEASDEELQTKFPVMAAFYLPGADVELPDTFSDVNTWRMILDTYFGTDLGLLEDRNYLIRDEQHLYTYYDVTDRID